MLLGEADVLLLAQLLLACRVDVGVVEEDRVVDPGSGDGFHDLAGAGRTARMQQQLVVAAGQGEGGADEIGHAEIH